MHSIYFVPGSRAGFEPSRASSASSPNYRAEPSSARSCTEPRRARLGSFPALLAGKQMGTEHAPFCRGPGSWTRSHVEATTSFGGCALARSLARRQDRIRRQRVGVLLGGEAHRGRQERDGRRRLLRQPRHKLSSCLPGGKLRRS